MFNTYSDLVIVKIEHFSAYFYFSLSQNLKFYSYPIKKIVHKFIFETLLDFRWNQASGVASSSARVCTPAVDPSLIKFDPSAIFYISKRNNEIN